MSAMTADCVNCMRGAVSEELLERAIADSSTSCVYCSYGVHTSFSAVNYMGKFLYHLIVAMTADCVNCMESSMSLRKKKVCFVTPHYSLYLPPSNSWCTQNGFQALCEKNSVQSKQNVSLIRPQRCVYYCAPPVCVPNVTMFEKMNRSYVS